MLRNKNVSNVSSATFRALGRNERSGENGSAGAEFIDRRRKTEDVMLSTFLLPVEYIFNAVQLLNRPLFLSTVGCASRFVFIQYV